MYEKIKHVKNALSPDFSLYTNMPIAMQIYNVYRNRWVGCYWLWRGFEHVIPTVAWSGPKSYDFCFLGAPRQSVIAVSPLGVYEPEAVQLFIDGYVEMCDRLDPTSILCYGKMDRIPLPSGLPPQIVFPNRWEVRKAAAEKAKREKFLNVEEDDKLKRAL